MADIAPSGVSFDSNTMQFNARVATLPAGGAVRAGVPGRINPTGEIVESLGAAATVAAHVHGIIAKSVSAAGAAAGLTTTLLSPNQVLQYDDTASMSVGALYLGTTGGFSDTATTGGTVPIALAVDSKNIQFTAQVLA